jgi:hypothetical protein
MMTRYGMVCHGMVTIFHLREVEVGCACVWLDGILMVVTLPRQKLVHFRPPVIRSGHIILAWGSPPYLFSSAPTLHAVPPFASVCLSLFGAICSLIFNLLFLDSAPI